MNSRVGTRTTVQRFTLISLAVCQRTTLMNWEWPGNEATVERYPVLKSMRMTGKGSVVPDS